MDVYSNLAGTTATRFRISKNGPTIHPGTADPNISVVSGEPGDVYILQGAAPRVFLRADGVWLPLSLDQQFNRQKILSTDYIASNENFYLGVAVGGTVSIYLPAGIQNKRFVIKDESGAANRTITIYPHDDETIDGAAQYVLSNPYNSINIVYGDEWHVY